MKLQPNSICKTCWNWSMGLPGNSCGLLLADGSRCGGVLSSFEEGEVSACSNCEGTGHKESSRCPTCYGYGLEHNSRP